ncbi:MAG TPA: type II secretion system protein N [Casimicrobiaceae bacterium]|nr:type II secretion system protein N [Casimicrobiaceae bacterium]
MTWPRVLLGGPILAAAVVLLAPAALLDAPLADRTGKRLRLTDARGVWWSGQGVVASADGTARVPLAWRVDPAALARGALAVRVRDADTAASMVSLTLSRESVDIRDLRLSLPAAVAGAFDTRLDAIALGGQVALAAPAYALRGPSRAGEIDATWQHARIVAGGANVDLGTVTLDSAPVDGGSAGTIRNAGGDVSIAGTFSDRAGALDVALTIAPAPTAPQSVRTLLPLLGPSDGAGGVRIAWRSRG